MNHQNTLTDRVALGRHRERSKTRFEPATFLHEEAILDIQERLSLVNKEFKKPAIVTGWAEIWQNVVPNSAIVADSETLDLAVGQYDLVIHAMSLHWANDPVGQLIQCRRALQPDGFFMCVLFGGQTLSELRAVLAEAETEILGGLSPRVAPMGEIRDLGGLMQRAGFALPVADSQTLTASYFNMTALMHDLRAMGETNALTARIRTPSNRTIFETATKRYKSAFPAEQNRIAATFELIYLAGWAPDDSQPQPLRPGSATARLSDVLGTSEIKLDPSS